MLRSTTLLCVLFLAAGQNVDVIRLGQTNVSGKGTTARASALAAAPANSTEADAAAEPGMMLPLSVTLPIILVLVMLSGLFSGLTLGLMGLDLIGLETIENGDNVEMAACAAKIKPIRERGNLLLSTLLLGNVAVNSALSILSADVASGPVGFVVSTALIVVFGEIIPQASCAKYALKIGARTVLIVKFLICFFFIITYPMSLCLDFMLGKDLGQLYSTSELMEMVKLQVERGSTDAETGRMAKQVVEGALKFRERTVGDVMTPVEDTYMLPGDTRLSYETIRDIHKLGFSRIPVYGQNKHDFRGLLYTKDLILVDPKDEMRLADFIDVFQRRALTFEKDHKLAECLAQFRKGSTHLALVREMNCADEKNPRVELMGVITLEDIVEEILQEEIIDEADVYVDVDNRKLVGDGREKRKFNLGLFNSKWSAQGQVLEPDERAAVAAHLGRAFKNDAALCMDLPAFEWLLAVSEVRNKERITPLGNEEPDQADTLYVKGKESDFCIVVLQGRVGVITGKDNFRTDTGAFSILARAALYDATFKSDFTGYLKTLKGRFIVITKKHFQMARDLNKDKTKLQAALAQVESFNAGESKDLMLRSDAMGFISFYGKRMGSSSIGTGLGSCKCIGWQ
eukprot:TRINITY_DN2796_c0_g1_i1.p1 TRINITY_DN2796_c0_g1~~TRINITY_DN2796_c0_g1_i1.p1  ORF type:complete len:628 (+),score=98.95 TRINITY_DN2796_c0_g1_i1:136-2019(+)